MQTEMADTDIKIERGLILCSFIIHALINSKKGGKWVAVNLQVAKWLKKNPCDYKIKLWEHYNTQSWMSWSELRLRSNADEAEAKRYNHKK